jgi:hypothetical protein
MRTRRGSGNGVRGTVEHRETAVTFATRTDHLPAMLGHEAFDKWVVAYQGETHGGDPRKGTCAGATVKFTCRTASGV